MLSFNLTEDFFNAIKDDRLDIVTQIMETQPMIFLEVDEKMQNALHLVAQYGRIEIANFLLPYQGVPTLL